MPSLVQKINVLLRVMPVREWTKEVLSNKLDLLSIPQIQGEIEVDLLSRKSLTGAFKTAHPGQISSAVTSIPPCFHQKICVKQVYQQRGNGSIGRYLPSEERGKILMELICLDWATILLDLTYGFIQAAVEEYGEPPRGIPQLRFVRTMLADSTSSIQKCFLIEEWVGTGAFTKYINNGRPESCVRADAPAEEHRIAEFLCFAQHVQYNQTGGLAFTSDYQGL